MFEKNYEYIGVFVGYLMKILEAVGNFIALITGKNTAAEATEPAADEEEAAG